MKINHLDAFSDNYIWTMESEGKLAIVDPGDAKPVHEYIKKNRICTYGCINHTSPLGSYWRS